MKICKKIEQEINEYFDAQKELSYESNEHIELCCECKKYFEVYPRIVHDLGFSLDNEIQKTGDFIIHDTRHLSLHHSTLSIKRIIAAAALFLLIITGGLKFGLPSIKERSLRARIIKEENREFVFSLMKIEELEAAEEAGPITLDDLQFQPLFDD